ncbi:MAG TPA: non-heme iron oxygenase ferredoxin subunit [Acidimicrobiales bacterium]|nr:non-heme iron oxygenase ferredoxin subunit [Acidimicrobiales bacterium]
MSELARVPADSVPDGKAIRLEAGPDGVCLVRIGSTFLAVADRCTHADVRLSEGDVDPEECSVECWKHGSAFSLVDGEPQSLPATRPVQVYPVERDGDDVVVLDS